jgi:hypothetical protein
MNEHIPALLPPEPKPPEVLAPHVAEAPPSSLMPSHSTEEIRAVDQAFASNREHADAVAGFVGLWLSAPWLADLLADHFRTPPVEDPDDPHRKLDGPEPHEHC